MTNENCYAYVFYNTQNESEQCKCEETDFFFLCIYTVLKQLEPFFFSCGLRFKLGLEKKRRLQEEV